MQPGHNSLVFQRKCTNNWVLRIRDGHETIDHLAASHGRPGAAVAPPADRVWPGLVDGTSARRGRRARLATGRRGKPQLRGARATQRDSGRIAAEPEERTRKTAPAPGRNYRG